MLLLLVLVLVLGEDYYEVFDDFDLLFIFKNEHIIYGSILVFYYIVCLFTCILRYFYKYFDEFANLFIDVCNVCKDKREELINCLLLLLLILINDELILLLILLLLLFKLL